MKFTTAALTVILATNHVYSFSQRSFPGTIVIRLTEHWLLAVKV